MFNCVCPKGLMNRAHAYKAMLEANAAQSEDPDNGVSMGLFCYPILMAADILMFNANLVPVGRDQTQHLEMARDIATRFNNLYGVQKDFFVMPYEQIDDDVEILPGLDGRKMSKSYNNVIPLFEGGSKALEQAIGRVVTDSKLPGEPKDPDSTSLTKIFDAFATPEEREAFRAELRGGLGWGEAKKRLVNQIEAEIGPMREKYAYYTSHTDELEDILQAGAEKARKLSAPFMERLREAVGLRSFRHVVAPKTAPQKAEPAKNAPTATFKQYREADGLFYFKLTLTGGRVLLTSKGFASGRDAGQSVAKLKSTCTLGDLEQNVVLGDGVTVAEVEAALAAAKAEDERKAAEKAQKAK